jgi:hypothetical protein
MRRLKLICIQRDHPHTACTYMIKLCSNCHVISNCIDPLSDGNWGHLSRKQVAGVYRYHPPPSGVECVEPLSMSSVHVHGMVHRHGDDFEIWSSHGGEHY